MSTQWEASGYYYPVQVAQFGLSHYSKNLSEPHPKMRNLENGRNFTANWHIPSEASLLRRQESTINSWVLDFYSKGIDTLMSIQAKTYLLSYL